MGLPWLGYICGGLFSKLCCLPTKDVIAIAIETGIQNTGISIFMLKLSLGRPEADLTTGNFLYLVFYLYIYLFLYVSISNGSKINSFKYFVK